MTIALRYVSYNYSMSNVLNSKYNSAQLFSMHANESNHDLRIAKQEEALYKEKYLDLGKVKL